MSLYLEVVSTTNEAQRYDLPDGETIIGRQPDCNIVLPLTTVSRRHARVLRSGLSVAVEDLGSQNGTLKSGMPIAAKIDLEPGDEFQIDQFVIRLHRRSLSDTAPEPLNDVPRVIVPGDSRETFAKMSQIGGILAEFDVDTSSVQRLKMHADQKLQAVLELINNADTSLELNQVLENLISGLMRIFPLAERGAVLLCNPEGTLELKTLKHRTNAAAEITGGELSRTIHDHVLRDVKVVLSENLQSDERFDGAASLVGAPIRSMMCAPLLGPSRQPLGVVQLDTCSKLGVFTPQDAEILASLATLTGLMVEAARWHAAQLELAQRKQDLLVAQTVQQQFLPQAAPALEEYDVFHFYEPAEAIGGDYYDLFEVGADRWALPIGDVAGKGVPAAMFMARLSGKVRVSVRENLSVAETLTHLNSRICERIAAGRFVTFSLAVLDVVEHTLTMANAGHIPPFWRHGKTGEVHLLNLESIAGPPLGLVENWEYKELSLALEPGDAVLFVTDGVSEAQNPDRDLLGLDAIAQCGVNAPDVIGWGRCVIDLVKAHLGGNTRRDDVCLVGISRKSV